jgi:ATP-binding cassette subfamily C (CFTR/MRP) protein 1
MILTGHLSMDMTNTSTGRITLARESLWLASFAFGIAEFILELYSPEKRWKGQIKLPDSDDEDEARDHVDGYTSMGKNEYGDVESPVVSANIYERLTFSWLTREFSSELC